MGYFQLTAHNMITTFSYHSTIQSATCFGCP